MVTPHSQRLDWPSVRSLRLRGRRIAEGYLGGGHSSHQRGPGLEFAGHRAYTPGDDLRWLDQRAVLRQDRLLIKQFETETDRHFELIVDASASMGFSSTPDLPSKFDRAAVLAVALSHIAIRSGDRVGLQVLDGTVGHALAPASGSQAFERVADTLEQSKPEGRLGSTPEELERVCARIAQRSRRGSLLVFLSDLLELPAEAPEILAGLGSGGRQLLLLQILDPMEAHLKVEGPVRFRSNETLEEVETNATRTRSSYLTRLSSLREQFERAARAHGGDFVHTTTATDPLSTIREALRKTARRTTQ